VDMTGLIILLKSMMY